MINRYPWPRGYVLGILFTCILGLSHQLLALQVEQTPPPAAPQTQTKPAIDPRAVTGKPAPASQPPKDDRIFFALPNLLTVENASSLPPLTTRQKFKTVAEGCFDPVEVVFIGIQAGIGQADKTNPTYGQGLIGYSNASGRRIPTPSSETSGRAPSSRLCCGKTRATTRWEKGISSAVPGTPPCGL